jgi:hypothetical protein
MHFTPTSGSWLNMVEIFFGMTTSQLSARECRAKAPAPPGG